MLKKEKEVDELSLCVVVDVAAAEEVASDDAATKLNPDATGAPEEGAVLAPPPTERLLHVKKVCMMCRIYMNDFV